ncbi:MAG: hypothetical protein ACYCUG_03485, partial [Acidimicrobiales bacterium]
NDWTCILVFACSVLALLIRGRAPAGDDIAGAPLAVHPSRYDRTPGAPAPVAVGATPEPPAATAGDPAG